MALSRQYQDKILRWIEEIQAVGRGLSKWETDFVESISEQMDNTGSLSPRQEEILERIFAEKTPL